MANRHKAQKFNVGGAAVAYGNQDVISAAKKGGTNPGIKPIQKKDGGKVEGKATGGRLDKRARGGKIAGTFARGGSPFSSASKVKG